MRSHFLSLLLLEKVLYSLWAIFRQIWLFPVLYLLAILDALLSIILLVQIDTPSIQIFQVSYLIFCFNCHCHILWVLSPKSPCFIISTKHDNCFICLQRFLWRSYFKISLNRILKLSSENLTVLTNYSSAEPHHYISK